MATKPRNQTRKTVGKGQADSRRQSRQHKAKAAENAARVAALTAAQAAPTPKGHKPEQWVTTRHIEVGDAVAPAIKGKQASGPALFRVVIEVDQLPLGRRKVRYEDGTTEQFGNGAKLFVAKPTKGAAPAAPPPADPNAPQAAADRAERLRLAKDEHKVLQQWIKNGEKPPRPATPNLDALSADNAAGGPRRATRTRTRTTGGDRLADRSPEYRKAVEAKKAGKRGKGKAVTEKELDTYIAKARAARPDSTMNEELEIAYWVAKLAISRPRWQQAWARSEAPAPLAKAS